MGLHFPPVLFGKHEANRLWFVWPQFMDAFLALLLKTKCLQCMHTAQAATSRGGLTPGLEREIKWMQRL